MSSDTRLHWVARNRRRPTLERHAATAITEMVERVQQAVEPIEEVAAVLGQHVDAEFKELCRIEAIEKGILRVVVAEPSDVTSMNRRWTQRIRQALPAKLKIRGVTFALGTRGYRID